MAMLEPPSVHTYEFYDSHRDSRLLDHQLEPSQIMSVLLRFKNRKVNVVKLPASLEQIQKTETGLQAVLSVKNSDLKETVTRSISVMDGLWTPQSNNTFEVNVGRYSLACVAVEAFFQDYDDGLDLSALFSSKSNELAYV